jgi:transposase
VLVTAADVQDRDGARPLLERLRATCPRIALVWADGGYAGQLVAWAAEAFTRLRVAVVKRTDKHRFVVLPRRWCVERTLSWIVHRRRCVRDYERRADTHEAMVRWAMTLVMARRLTRSQ